jgi:hypothetical protein
MEHVMRIARHLLIWSPISLSVAVAAILTRSASLMYVAVLSDRNSQDAPSYFEAPSHIQAGVPFIVRDNYATQVCISTRSGKPLPPFITPPGQFDVVLQGPVRVQAWVPFEVQDSYGSQICISSRGGEPLLPFVVR